MEDMAGLDTSAAVRIKKTVERLAQTGAGNIKALRGFHPPEFRLRAGDWRVRFHQDEDTIRILRVCHRRDAYR